MKNEKITNNFKRLEEFCQHGKKMDASDTLSLLCTFLHYLCGAITEVILRLPEPKQKKK